MESEQDDISDGPRSIRLGPQVSLFCDAVYVAAPDPGYLDYGDAPYGALARIDRNTSTGALAPQGCVGDDDATTFDTRLPGCAQRIGGLANAQSVVVSPDGASVYVAAQTDSSIARFTRDDDPPETSIDSGPAEGSTTANSSPTFGLSSNEVGSTFECSVDGGAFASCPSTFSAGPLANGQHGLAVRAKDLAINVDPTPASRTFTVNAPIAGTPPAAKENPLCAKLRAKLKRTQSKKQKRKIRGRLRRLDC